MEELGFFQFMRQTQEERIVIQFAVHGPQIGEYVSINEASKATKIPAPTIRNICNPNTMGYKAGNKEKEYEWFFKDYFDLFPRRLKRMRARGTNEFWRIPDGEQGMPSGIPNIQKEYQQAREERGRTRAKVKRTIDNF